MMELFRPHELMAVVVGNEDYDWHILESEAEYRNGYTSGDQTVCFLVDFSHKEILRSMLMNLDPLVLGSIP